MASLTSPADLQAWLKSNPGLTTARAFAGATRGAGRFACCRGGARREAGAGGRAHSTAAQGAAPQRNRPRSGRATCCRKRAKGSRDKIQPPSRRGARPRRGCAPAVLAAGFAAKFGRCGDAAWRQFSRGEFSFIFSWAYVARWDRSSVASIQSE